MNADQPSRRDMAEFFRFALRAGLCEVPTVVHWADSIVEVEAAPHIAFIELCTSGSLPSSSVQTLLAEVPGEPSPLKAVQLLLGHAHRLLKAHTIPAGELLLSIYRVSKDRAFPESIYFKLIGLEADYFLACDGVVGIRTEIENDFSSFLADYESHVPDIPIGNA